MATDRVLQLTLYGRKECHLCDEMAAALGELRDVSRFAIEVVDVDTSADLAQRYGERVPVLTYGANEICHGRLDRSAVTAFLARFR